MSEVLKKSPKIASIYSRGKSLLKIAYVIFVILKSHDFFCDFFAILVHFNDFCVSFSISFSDL